MLANRTIRYGGWTFALAALLYIPTFVVRGAPYGLFGLLATILLAPSVWGLYEYYGRHDEGYKIRLGTVALLVGALFITGLYWGALVAGLAERELGQPLADIEAAFEGFTSAVGAVAIMLGNIIFIGTFLLALSSVQTGSDPKWLGWLGIVGSVLTFPWFFFALAPPILQAGPALGFLLVIVWMVVMGVRMARYESQ